MKKYNFTRKEFACKCGCGLDTIDFELLNMLEDGREYFTKKYGKVRCDITGGNRCELHNEVVQKKYNKNYVPFSSKSTHKKAQGADHKYYYYKKGSWIQISPKEVYNYYDKKYPNSVGVGYYKNRTHIDPRAKKVRWGKR